ncbi:type VI secretion system-associated FHA domain protein TagH [Agaribacterium haliotis]|uniref:type VI secretion system-associated FHA domain protein TagH n=1 Tax=Agaribacterium haliotis TaxID=2013869 RepID=UPI000BB5861A|nr:type VI secretion system-associated FHA domain protein TagH [Agaribacterium haliotis]
MELVLTVINAPAGVELTAKECRFSEFPVSLGRGDGNTWKLQDPDRFLSSRHCELSVENECVKLLDLSTNGTFVGGDAAPLGKGAATTLASGAQFAIGDYLLSVDLVGAGSAAFDDFASAAPMPTPATGPASLDDIWGAPAATAQPDGDFASSDFASAGNAGAASLDPLDVFGSDELGLGGASPGSTQDPLSAFSEPASPGPSPSFEPFGGDPFGGEAAQQTPASAGQLGNDPFAASTDDPFASPLGADPFATEPPAAEQAAVSYGDANPNVLDSSFSLPETRDNGFIPENWEDDFLAPEPAAEAQVPASGAAQGAVPGVIPEAVPGAVPGPSSAPAGEAASVPEAAPAPISAATPAPAQAPTPTPAQAPTPAPGQTPAPTQRSAPAHAATPAQAESHAAAQQAALVHTGVRPAISDGEAQGSADSAFLTALGLDAAALGPQKSAEVAEQAGLLLREITGGMMKLLRSRTSIKNEFRMNVTTIQPAENNPLKFSASVDEALNTMFVSPHSAYKDASASFKEGFEGVAEHQLAIVSGIRTAFERMLARFDPLSLETRWNKGKRGAAIAAMQRAKNWSLFEEYYNCLKADEEQCFQQFFGDDFVQAYEDQLRRLKAERKVAPDASAPDSLT